MRKIFYFALFIFVFHSVASADLYRILGVMSYSSLEKITKNYERTKERIHPNHNSNSRESRERFQELEEAYEILSDSEHRAQYDKHLKETQTDKELNFYKTIGVLSDSSPEQITKAYKERRPIVHPDRHNNNDESNRRFKELQKAFKTLADPMLRLKHNASLGIGKNYILPYFSAEREQRQRDLREQASDRRVHTGTVQKDIDGSNIKALFIEGAEQIAENREIVDAWNKQVFQLAQDLEKEGGSENIEEAISWYRMLAQEGHLEATWELAPLLEDIDIEEALYRYSQVQVLDTDGELARSVVFRQAQIYQVGVYKEEKAILLPNPERAAELYEEAFRLGVPQQKIAEQYDKHRDYQMALKWQLREKNGSDKQQLTGDKEESRLMVMKDWYFHQPYRNALTSLHSAIAHRDQNDLPEDGTTLGERQEAVIAMIHSVFDEEIDINAQDSFGETGLDYAIHRGYLQVVELLLEMNINVNIPNRLGEIALFHALEDWDLHRRKPLINIRDEETIQRILSSLIRRTDLSIRNQKDRLPLYLAIRYHHPKSAVEIIQNGGAENLTDRELYGLLYLVVNNKYDQSGVAEEIIKRGGAKNLSKEQHNKLLQLSIRNGHSNVVRFLKQTPVMAGPPQIRPESGSASQFLNFCRNFFSLSLNPRDK